MKTTVDLNQNGGWNRIVFRANGGSIKYCRVMRDEDMYEYVCLCVKVYMCVFVKVYMCMLSGMSFKGIST